MSTNYDKQAENWHRDEPKHDTDFVGRPEVLEVFKEIGKGKAVLDLGCGEGYFSRQMAGIAKKVIGVDISEKMIELAIEREKEEKRGIEYHLGDVRCMPFVQDASIDVCVGNFIVNYIHPDELPVFYSEIARVLVDKGQFVLLLPHLPLHLAKQYGEAVHFERKGYDYFKSRGWYFKATLKTVQGDVFEVGEYHSTLEDQFKGISLAGLAVTRILEPVFTPDITEKYPLFKELEGEPISMIIVGKKLK